MNIQVATLRMWLSNHIEEDSDLLLACLNGAIKQIEECLDNSGISHGINSVSPSNLTPLLVYPACADKLSTTNFGIIVSSKAAKTKL